MPTSDKTQLDISVSSASIEKNHCDEELSPRSQILFEGTRQKKQNTTSTNKNLLQNDEISI